MPNIEQLVRDSFVDVLNEPDLQSGGLNIDRDMADEYGLTSLNKILLITSICDEAQIDLRHFTEHDLADMRTLREVIDAMSRASRARLVS